MPAKTTDCAKSEPYIDHKLNCTITILNCTIPNLIVNHKLNCKLIMELITYPTYWQVFVNSLQGAGRAISKVQDIFW